MSTKLNTESIIDGSIEKGKLSESVQESLNKADNAMQGIIINGESKTPDENGVVDLGNIYITTLTYKAISKVENTGYQWSNDTFGATIISHEYDVATGVGVIYFSDRITTIGDNAFAGCTNLTSITIPDSVTTIGKFTFSSCTNLTRVTIGDGVTEIGDQAFEGCVNLTNINIPDSVTTIGEYAFSNCSSLTSITIGDSVTTIGEYAFSGCSSITSVTIPDSVTTIVGSAFRGCTGELFVNCNIPLAAFQNSTFTAVTIGDNVTTIGQSAFFFCGSLTSVTIGNGVTSIANQAFYSCSRLTSVYCKAVTPPAGDSDMFNRNASDRKIYVPAESVEAYKSASYWSDYADDIVGYRFNADFNDYYTKSETDDKIEGAISDLADVAQSGSYNDLSDTPSPVTSSTVSGWGFTKNTGTITKVSANGTSIATSGVANIPAASISVYGVTKLSSATNSESIVVAATPSAVKSAYDLANSKYTKPEEGISYVDLHEDVLGDLNRAKSALIPSDLYYEVVSSFTIDDLNDAYLNNNGSMTIGFADYDCFHQSKRVVIKENENSDTVYPLTFTKQGTGVSGNYSGRVSFNAKGISYEFDISISMTMGTGTISNIKKYYNNYVADFRIYDLENIIDEGISKSINVQNLYLAIKNNKNIVVYTNEYDPDYSKGMMNILTGGITNDDNESKVFDCVINTHDGSWKLTNLVYDTSDPEGHIYSLNNSNVKFYHTQPYVLDFTMEDIEDLNEGDIDEIYYNSFNLYNAIKNGRQILIKESSTSSTMITVTASSYIGGESKFALGIFDGCYLWRIMVYLSEQGGQEPRSIIYNDISSYELPYINPDSGGFKRFIASSDLKSINNKSIYKSTTTDVGNIYTYYPISPVNGSSVTITINPNTFYKFGTSTTPLTSIGITLGSEISSVVNEYIFEIYTTTVVPTLSLTPRNSTDTIKWVSGDAPVLEENKIYQISIVNNLGTVLSWDNVNNA